MLRTRDGLIEKKIADAARSCGGIECGSRGTHSLIVLHRYDCISVHNKPLSDLIFGIGMTSRPSSCRYRNPLLSAAPLTECVWCVLMRSRDVIKRLEAGGWVLSH